MSFSETLKSLRKSHKHTQKELADLLGVKKSSISNYETDRSYPKRLVLMKIAKLYDVSIDRLVDEYKPISLSSESSFHNPAVKRISVYKKIEDCFLAEASVMYQITIPAALIGKGTYRAFMNDRGLMIIDLETTPSAGDFVYAKTSDGKIIYGKYYKKASSETIVSELVDDNKTATLFDVKKDKLTILAVATKVFSDLN